MTSDSTDLIERIREHCRQQRWFGPDGDHPSTSWSQHEVVRDPDTGQWHKRDPWADRRVFEFAYPPATEEQLRTTERALGFSLPSVLRAVYVRVANGGFGPGYGLAGAHGGFLFDDVRRPSVSVAEVPGSSADDGLRCKVPTIAASLTVGVWRMAAATASALKESPDCYLECPTDPDGLVTLCHWGCSIYSVFDRWTGFVYTSAPYVRHDFDYYPRHVAPDGDDIVVGLQYQADSIEDWLSRWLADDLFQSDAEVPILLNDVDGLANTISEKRVTALQRDATARAAYYAEFPPLVTSDQLRSKGIHRVPRGAHFPSVVLPSTSGRDVNLADEARARHLVLFFYPGDGASLQYPRLAGCTAEACAFRDSLTEFHALGAAIYGISLQPTERQRQFAARENLTYELLSDERGKLISSLNIPRWVSRSGEEFVDRTTLIIERGGRIAEVYADVQVAGHVDEVLAAVRRLPAQDDTLGGERK